MIRIGFLAVALVEIIVGSTMLIPFHLGTDTYTKPAGAFLLALLMLCFGCLCLVFGTIGFQRLSNTSVSALQRVC